MALYVHGYSDLESGRLEDQASVLAGYLHHDSSFPSESRVLEVGCGTGAQTKILAAANPDVFFTSIDINKDSLEQAAKDIKRYGIKNVKFIHADVYNLPFQSIRFDHIFCCFILEHLPDPQNALGILKKLLTDRGTITLIEGDHGSFFSYPESRESKKVVECLVELQAKAGGDALIGRRLYALLRQAGYKDIAITPRQIYADPSRPEIVESFSKKTFIAMVEGVRDRALSQGLVSERTWDKGIKDLYRATGSDGSFTYTFFKAVAQATESNPGII